MPQKYPKEFLELCKSVTAKRPKTVIDHILKHGHITTEELKEKYGYNHPLFLRRLKSFSSRNMAANALFILKTWIKASFR